MGFANISLLVAALDIRARQKTRLLSHLARTYPLTKRVTETVIALVLLVLLAPVFLFITLAVRLDSPGPAIFRQTRIGRNGKPFTFFKFRTMHRDIDRRAHMAFLRAFVNGHIDNGENGAGVFKPAQRKQITQLGIFLRRTSLDELPQLVNIIRGEMGFIGPRPNIVAEVESYEDWHRKRLEILPGITGLAQINGRSSLTFDEIARYDIEYAENQSLALDLLIVLHTLPVVLFCRGAK